ncbi:hypothetical protein DL345_10005 [Citrobacter koseri]|nr:hypothetical protein DL345_10005 [Citrobacter koseri]
MQQELIFSWCYLKNKRFATSSKVECSASCEPDAILSRLKRAPACGIISIHVDCKNNGEKDG